MQTCTQCGKDSPSVSQEHQWCFKCLDGHVHKWVPQITGEDKNVEACEDCLDIREV